MTTEADSNHRPAPRSAAFKPIALVILAVTAAFLYYLFHDSLDLASLAKREAALRTYQSQHPALVFGLAFVVYVLVTGFSLPGAAVLTLVYGWYFGLAAGTVLVSFASTTGATIAFLFSRYFFRDSIQQRFHDRLASFNQSFASEGAFFLFTLRLLPVVPFFVINAVMGLTPIGTRTFWWVSQLGMLPGTVVYVYAGSSVPDLQTLADDGIAAVFSTEQLTQLFVAFALLGCFPLAVRFAINRFSRSRTASHE